MAHYNVKPIRLTLRRSLLLAASFAAASVAAVTIVLCMPVHPGIKIAACLLIAAAAIRTLLQHAWLALPGSYQGLEVDSRGELRLWRKDGTQQAAAVLPDSVAHPYLTILNIRAAGCRWRGSVLITPDRVDAEPFRQLRVWLRWGRHDWRQRLGEEEAF